MRFIKGHPWWGVDRFVPGSIHRISRLGYDVVRFEGVVTKSSDPTSFLLLSFSQLFSFSLLEGGVVGYIIRLNIVSYLCFLTHVIIDGI